MELSPVSARVLAGVLEQRTGQQLAAGRSWRLDVALDPLVRERGYASADEIAAAVAGGRDPRLSAAVVEALLNNETSFFRDAAMFRQLVQDALPKLVARRPIDRRLRIWSAGCSTGQEPYSLAMTLAGLPLLAGWTIDIVATDVSATAIAQARTGAYSQFEIQRGLPVRDMLRWFAQDPADERWRATAELRGRVRFHVLSLLDRPPLPGRFDIILCRNVLLYFNAGIRRQVFERLADACVADGILALGAGETVIGQTERFESDVEHRGLYHPVRA